MWSILVRQIVESMLSTWNIWTSVKCEYIFDSYPRAFFASTRQRSQNSEGFGKSHAWAFVGCLHELSRITRKLFAAFAHSHLFARCAFARSTYTRAWLLLFRVSTSFHSPQNDAQHSELFVAEFSLTILMRNKSPSSKLLTYWQTNGKISINQD